MAESIFQTPPTDFDALHREFVWRIPARFNIAQQCCDRHAAGADGIAVHYENLAGDAARYRFSDLKRLSDRFAQALRDLGIVHGDRVAMVLPQRPETVIAHLASYKLGAVAVPLSILFGEDALSFRLRDSGAKVVISDTSRLRLIDRLAPDLPDLKYVIGCAPDQGVPDLWSLLNQATGDADPVDTAADDPALLIYTSGTTGPPKGALVAHRALLGNLPGFELSHNLFPQPGDLFWTPADWAWTGGLWDALLPTLYHGMPILGYEGGKFDAEKACALMDTYQVRNAFLPPTAIKMLMQVPDMAQRYNIVLRSIMSAGEQVGAELIRWGEQTLGVTINEMWGQTEVNYLVGNCAALMPVRPGSMGKPYPGHAVDVIDPEGKVLPDGETGELAVRRGDPVMCLGYWNNEQATRGKFVGDWFCTGDMGYRDGEGYLWFLGRKDDVISSAGYRIGPGEIEDSLLKHPAVAQAAVIGKPDALRGSIIKAFVVLSDGYEASQELAADIRESIRTRLATYEYPREIEFIDALPMTTTGKVRRIDLRHREEAASENRNAF